MESPASTAVGDSSRMSTRKSPRRSGVTVGTSEGDASLRRSSRGRAKSAKELVPATPDEGGRGGDGEGGEVRRRMIHCILITNFSPLHCISLWLHNYFSKFIVMEEERQFRFCVRRRSGDRLLQEDDSMSTHLASFELQEDRGTERID